MEPVRLFYIIAVTMATSQTLMAAKKNKRPLVDIMITNSPGGGGGVIDPAPLDPNLSGPYVTASGPSLKSDPANINSHIFDLCSSKSTDPNKNFQSLFEGLFMSTSELDNFVKEKETELKQRRKISKHKNYVKRSKIVKTLGTIGTFSFNKEQTNNTCCETNYEVIKPETVNENGREMYLAHLNNSYQYYQQGLCVQPDATCRGIGKCTQQFKTTFMLFYDPLLINEFKLPVRFGAIEMKSHCECVNIGS